MDLAVLWPRLWLLLPDSSRTPLADARRHLDEAARLGGWALLYLQLGTVWWPSVVIGVVAGLVAHQRYRSAADVYAGLVEPAVDVHLDELRFPTVSTCGPRPHWGSRPQNGSARVCERVATTGCQRSPNTDLVGGQLDRV